MLIRRHKPWHLTDNDVTDEQLFRNRRTIIKSLALGAAAAGLVGCDTRNVDARSDPQTGLRADPNPEFSTGEEKTSYAAVTGYNNFYEFGTGKEDPAQYAGAMTTDPWSISVEGAVANPGRYALEDLIDFNALEERIYRLRCVEAWSMVVPWIGVPLKTVIDRLEPLGRAKYVQFETLVDPETMPGVRFPVLDWPYVEGLRLDEARNSLTLLAIGLYGKEMPNQNGAPIRLVVPWKYGFKSIKSIVAMRFVTEQPNTSWNMAAPWEYGFYSNVNPNVDHARWSQATERRIGELTRRKTLMFNGYADEVAHLYEGMNLRKNF